MSGVAREAPTAGPCAGGSAEAAGRDPNARVSASAEPAIRGTSRVFVIICLLLPFWLALRTASRDAPSPHTLSGGQSKQPSIGSFGTPASQFGTMPRLCSHRSEEHTSELQSLMRISYAVFCLKKKNTKLNT